MSLAKCKSLADSIARLMRRRSCRSVVCALDPAAGPVARRSAAARRGARSRATGAAGRDRAARRRTAASPSAPTRADRAAPHRRQARRSDLRRDRGHQRLRAAGARRGPAGDREDRGVGVLRRRPRLRRRRAAGRRSPSGASPTRCGATPTSCARTTPSRVLFDTFHDRRNGYHLLRQPDRRPRRQPDHRRRPAQRRLEHGVERQDRPLRRRLDHRDGDSVQVAALSAGPRSDLGHQPAARRALEERVVVPRAGAARADDVPRHPEGLVGGDAGRPAGAVGQPQHRAEAVRARRRHDRQHGDAAPAERRRRAGRRRREVRR